MMPYTTPVHTFRIPFSTSNLSAVKISYAQKNNVLVEKTKEDCELLRDEIKVMLTQEETALFQPGCLVQIQMHVLTDAGVSMQSQMLHESCEAVLDCEVIHSDES